MAELLNRFFGLPERPLTPPQVAEQEREVARAAALAEQETEKHLRAIAVQRSLIGRLGEVCDLAQRERRL